MVEDGHTAQAGYFLPTLLRHPVCTHTTAYGCSLPGLTRFTAVCALRDRSSLFSRKHLCLCGIASLLPSAPPYRHGGYRMLPRHPRLSLYLTYGVMILKNYNFNIIL